jgi:hypothetical protein
LVNLNQQNFLSIIMNFMFEKTLQDLVKGIRANKNSEEKYIQECIHEIRKEVNSKEYQIKAVAIQKLTYVKYFLKKVTYDRIRHEMGSFSCS